MSKPELTLSQVRDIFKSLPHPEKWWEGNYERPYELIVMEPTNLLSFLESSKAPEDPVATGWRLSFSVTREYGTCHWISNQEILIKKEQR